MQPGVDGATLALDVRGECAAEDCLEFVDVQGDTHRFVRDEGRSALIHYEKARGSEFWAEAPGRLTDEIKAEKTMKLNVGEIHWVIYILGVRLREGNVTGHVSMHLCPLFQSQWRPAARHLHRLLSSLNPEQSLGGDWESVVGDAAETEFKFADTQEIHRSAGIQLSNGGRTATFTQWREPNMLRALGEPPTFSELDFQIQLDSISEGSSATIGLIGSDHRSTVSVTSGSHVFDGSAGPGRPNRTWVANATSWLPLVTVHVAYRVEPAGRALASFAWVHGGFSTVYPPLESRIEFQVAAPLAIPVQPFIRIAPAGGTASFVNARVLAPLTLV